MRVDPGLVIFLAFFLLVGGRFLLKFIKYGGFKAAMFGAPIAQTLGKADGTGSRMMSMSVKVHRLDGGQERAVGIEFVAKGFASYQMLPVALSAVEAKKLAQLVDAAARGVSTGQPR